MSPHPGLLLAFDPPARAALASLFGAHPDAHVDPELDLLALGRWAGSVTAQGSTHADHPWDSAAPWADEAVPDYLAWVAGDRARAAGRPCWATTLPPRTDLLPALRAHLPQARVVHLVSDGRAAAARDLARLPAGPARRARCASLARAWAQVVGPLVAARQAPALHTVALPRLAASPGPVVDAARAHLGWPAHAGWVTAVHQQAAKVLPRPLRLAPLDEAVFRAHAPAEALLRTLGLPLGPVPPPPDEPAVLQARADGLADQGDREGAIAVLQEACTRHPRAGALGVRLAALQLEAGAEEAALATLAGPLGQAEHRDAALCLLFDRAPLSVMARPWLAVGRRSANPGVRQALARCLVVRGLDPEAAEVAAGVAMTVWWVGAASG